MGQNFIAMQSAGRGAEEEVFETPDLDEDDAIESGMAPPGIDGRPDSSSRSVNKVSKRRRLTGYVYLFIC